MTRCGPFIRLILRRAQAHALPRKRNHRVAPVSKDAAAPWFETPRTRLRNLSRSKVAAPHHEAGRDRECIKLIGIRFSAPLLPKFVSGDAATTHELRKRGTGRS